LHAKSNPTCWQPAGAARDFPPKYGKGALSLAPVIVFNVLPTGGPRFIFQDFGQAYRFARSYFKRRHRDMHPDQIAPAVNDQFCETVRAMRAVNPRHSFVLIRHRRAIS